MNLLDLTVAARDLGRLREIAGALARYGFADVAHRLGVAHALERAGEAMQWKGAADYVRLEPPERLRRALQDLGPAFVKLGQLLATRVDLFAPEWIAEFEKLQDDAPPSPAGQVRAQLVEDFGAAPEELFARFDAEPIAAGSIAQVHRACLADGTRVAVKVRRPGIRDTVEADLSLLARLARAAETRLPDLARYRPAEVVRQLAQTLRDELDLAVECRSAERVARSFAADDAIVVPAVYWPLTGERVNVQQYIEGIGSREAGALEAAGLDRRTLALRGAQAMLRMVIEHGFFHADPHPGNLFYLPGNRIAFIDFGMVGRLGGTRREELVLLLAALVDRDADAAADVLAEWSGGGADAAALTRDVELFIERYHGMSLRELRAGALFADLTRLLREHRLVLPPDLALVLKVCVELESTGRQLDADFDMVAAAAPIVRAVLAERRGPAAMARRGWRAAATAVSLLAELPRDLRRLLRAARRSGVQVHVEVGGLDAFGARLDRAASRLTLGVVTAALIIGSSIVMTVPGGPTVLGLPFFGLAGFLGALAGGAWLLLSIRRSGRKLPR